VVPNVPPAVVTTRRFQSAARNRTVELVAMTPIGATAGQLPVCLVLHGRGNSAQGMVPLGLPQFLTAAIRAGMPPVALVAVDGGDSYWIANTSSDDPQRMLTQELPGWLASLGLSDIPSTVLGISMGCFGALVYARKAPPRRVALLSPALFQNWTDASGVRVFADQAHWAEYEPLQHISELSHDMSLGVWCGREDPFFVAATRLAADTRPAIASFPHGEHNDGFWRRVLPDAISFLDSR
jgi:S-formylglutathione hydrolase FrmB